MAKNGIYEYTGIVEHVGEVEEFSGGKFRKQTLVLGADIGEDGGKFPPKNPFEFKNDHINDLVGIVKGMRVKVVFALDGREWLDPRTKRVRYFAGMSAFKVERLAGGEAAPEPATPPEDPASGSEALDDDEMPF